jgi:hypothetical protein
MSIVGILMMVQYVSVPFIVVNLWPWAAPPPAGGGRQRSGLAKRDWSREMIKAVVVGDGEFSAQHLSPHFATCALLLYVISFAHSVVPSVSLFCFYATLILSDEKHEH